MRRVVDVVVASACVCLVVTGRLTFLFEMLNSDDAIWRQSARWVAASVTGAALATHVDAPLAGAGLEMIHIPAETLASPEAEL